MTADEARALVQSCAESAEERKRQAAEAERNEAFARIRAACECGARACWFAGRNMHWLESYGYQVRLVTVGIKERWCVEW
jgi:hypothetical protein